jgi:pimeloyl-ACP methyl ester carboxylesterase
VRTLFTPGDVRLRQHASRPGALNWLLLPGGPGIGSESLEELAACLEVPGGIWLVDLPGDGSNRRLPPGAGAGFAAWPGVAVEAAQALPNPVYAGHSTGGMYLLATPALHSHLRGLALLDSAPDASWHPRFLEMTRAHPLPEVEAATAVYARDRRDDNIAAIAVASAPWNFTPAGLTAGRELLARMPYNSAAVDWSEENFDHTYRAAWWPTEIPVLRLAGAADRIVWQGGWQEERFRTANRIDCEVAGAGHFPWIENPAAVRAAFNRLAARVLERVPA